MDVSINYPWGSNVSIDPANGQVTYSASPGWDFGLAPAGWGLPDPRPPSAHRTAACRPAKVPFWLVHLPGDLRDFAKLGIKAVRFALLFNGLTYGTGGDIPHLGPGDTWVFEPTPLSSEFLADFGSLVRLFDALRTSDGRPRLRLMPVIVGFELVEDPYQRHGEWNSYISSPGQRNLNGYSDFVDQCGVQYRAGRRGDALSSGPSRASIGAAAAQQTRQERFLELVVGRLLAEFAPGGPLSDCRDVIHSWDLCGEPEAIAAMPNQPVSPQAPVSNTDMGQYLSDGITRVQRAGFAATVGFRYLNAAAPRGWHLPVHLGQFHTYDGERLPLVSGGDDALIGEAAMTDTSTFDPRLPPTTLGRGRIEVRPLGLRLEWMERLRYQEVFLWSAGRAPRDERHSWTRTEMAQIHAFTSGRRPYRQQVDEAFGRAYPGGPR